MQARHSNRKQYFDEQTYTTKKYVIPFIEQVLPLKKEMKILEIGCGEGGNLVPFAKLGMKCYGVDLSLKKIEVAEEYNDEYENLSFFAEDIYDFEKRINDHFDVIFLRDVIEHIPNHVKLLKIIKRLLGKNGVAFFGFPPWQNPFGGHQQMLSHKYLSKVPYLHLLPAFLYKKTMKFFGESEIKQNGMLALIDTKTSIEEFEKDVKTANLKIVLKQHYFINPNYEIKFGLKPRNQNPIVSSIPWIRNFLSTASYYIIK